MFVNLSDSLYQKHLVRQKGEFCAMYIFARNSNSRHLLYF